MIIESIGHVALAAPAVALVVYGVVQITRVFFVSLGYGNIDGDLLRYSAIIGLGAALGVAAWTV